MPESAVRQVLTCYWAARRLHRYLDADPSMPLNETEIRRLEDHLTQCEKCREHAREFRGLGALLRSLRAASEPDAEAIARLKARLATIIDGEPT